MMADQKLLSIVLTAHNCEAYLDKTLASLVDSLADLKEGYEIILISDASTDRTADILQQFAEHRAHAHLFQVDFRNIGKVRNYGVQQCSGDYITMLDGDDWLLPGALRDIVPFLAASRPDVLLTKLNEVHDDSDLNVSWDGLRPQSWSGHQAIKKYLIHKDIQAHFIGQFVKRELLSAHPFPAFRCYEDAFLFPTILTLSQNTVFSRHSPYLYFKRGNSLSNQIDNQKIDLLIEAMEETERVFGKQYANLLMCHWINIFHRYGQSMENSESRRKIISKIKSINSLSFLLDPAIRLSFKKKYLKVRNGK
ncbi:TPA: glycosyltransferase family 2 protein [Serratia marcescens]|nr:glycosyltransferase family 2 protein [Serratia sp. FDAARGOS_506]HAT4984875.1 glycosyltransferase family 2 protein [Serratia marcescens]HAT5032163.1 glycosyltransferase family 2 protein [Serratia marcescens]